jgi:hypothetical protein
VKLPSTMRLLLALLARYLVISLIFGLYLQSATPQT